MRALHSLPLALIALLASASASAQRDCPTEGGIQNIYGAPVPVQAIAIGRPVRVRRGAVLALEGVRLARRAWRADGPVRLGGSHPHDYKASALVTAVDSEAGERRCLADSDGPSEGAYIACLLDNDGDGAHDGAELFWRDDLISNFGRPARFERVALVQLQAPVRLTEAPEGLEEGRTTALRRIAVVALRGDRAEVEVSHAAVVERRSPVAVVIGPRGRTVRTLRPRPEEPKFLPWPGSRRAVALVDGAVEEIGGVGFRVARGPRGWTITPLAERFPQWIATECRGTRLQIGRS